MVSFASDGVVPNASCSHSTICRRVTPGHGRPRFRSRRRYIRIRSRRILHRVENKGCHDGPNGFVVLCVYETKDEAQNLPQACSVGFGQRSLEDKRGIYVVGALWVARPAARAGCSHHATSLRESARESVHYKNGLIDRIHQRRVGDFGLQSIFNL
jgi:hypothetical protein